MNKKLGRLLQPGMVTYFVIMLAFSAAAFFEQQIDLAAMELVVTVGLFVYYQVRKGKRQREIQSFIRSTSDSLEAASRGESPFAMVLMRVADGTLIWANERFTDISGFKDRMYEQKVADAIPGFSKDWLVKGKHEYPHDLTFGNRRYRLYGSTFRADDPDKTMLGILYLADLTELYLVRDEYVRSRPVVSIIMVDNYDELTQSLQEGQISTLNAHINDVIVQWTKDTGGLLRKVERNRYLFIFERRDLPRLIEGKFSILEDIRKVTTPDGVAATISYGVGLDGDNFDESYRFANLSIEMALSRGGDQAVIKDRVNFNFYGGRSEETNHRSKVRARVTANSLIELIGQSSQVFIMGHKNADLDAVGAAVGVRCLCRKKGKRSSIVIDLEHNCSLEMLAELKADPEYADAFISGQEALLRCDNNSILVVVDTNRPDQVECRPLLESISKVCVVDHHRRAADYINPVVVNFHETAASSAAELVTDLLQYVTEKDDILPVEAKALLAGIFLDTKSFNVRTGERTFEAAAYLRRLGADPVDVKKLLQTDFDDTVAKYKIIQSAELYRNEIAIAALDHDTSRALAAKAADELLNISGISTSFVMYPHEGQVIISARSIGATNVQMILEPLGGGGNAATAGCQVKNSTVPDTLEQLTASIDKYFEE